MLLHHPGKSFAIVYLDATEATRDAAEALVPPNLRACIAQVDRVLLRLAEHGAVRDERLFRHEEDQIYAAKGRCGLRAYGFFWHETPFGRAFIVSNYAMKKQDKAKPADLQRAKDARARLSG